MFIAIVFANNPAYISAYLGVSTYDMKSSHDLIASNMNKIYIGNGR